MTVDMEQLAITTYHYRQLDFLRLFKLARSLEIIKRKRKMPVEYQSNLEKGPTNARSACRRLLREVVKHLFPGSEINSNWNNYFIHIPTDIREVLTYIQRNHGRLERSDDRSIRDMIGHYNELREHIDGYVYPGFPFQVNVRLSSSSHSRYRRQRMAARGQGANIRPSENFYKCALACVQYKALWNRHMDDICKIVNSIKKKEEERGKNKPSKKKKPPRRAATTSNAGLPVPAPTPSVVLTVEDGPVVDAASTTDPDVIAAIADQARQAREERVRNAQGVFDQAFQRFVQRRDQE